MINKRFYILALLGLFIAIAATAAAERSPGHARLPGNVRQPLEVRVFEGGKFVDDLGLKDIELFESDVPAIPEALFLVRRGQIERREGAADVRPDLSRRLSLLFQLNEYSNKIREAIEYFFTNELMPGDTLEIQTPVRNYRLSAQHLAAKPRNILAEELTKIVRKDIMQGNAAYNSLLRELKTVVRLITWAGHGEVSDSEGEINSDTPLEVQLTNYRQNLQEMEVMRSMTDANLAAYASKLRALPGQKFVFIFYQREFRPELDSNILAGMMRSYQDRPDIMADLQSIFPLYQRSTTLNYAKLRQLFADSLANVNFLFMNKQSERVLGITMREQSEDVFKALSTIAEATGGIVDSSQNPAASIKTAAKAADSYYLLFYTPVVSVPPGTFLDLKVKVKGQNYKVVHSAGHFSRS